MKRAAFSLAALIAASCGSRSEPADKAHQPLPGMTEACAKQVRAYGLTNVALPTDACFEMTPRQRWRGLWRLAFEQSQFCPGAAADCSLNDKPGIWLNVQNTGQSEPAADGFYKVELVGRRTKVPVRFFGHMNQYDHELIADRIVSITKVRDLER